MCNENITSALDTLNADISAIGSGVSSVSNSTSVIGGSISATGIDISNVGNNITSLGSNVGALSAEIASIGNSVNALSGDITSLVNSMLDSCGGGIDVRQTVLDGRRNSNGYADFIEASGDSNIISLLHFNSNIIDQTGITWTPYGSPTYTTGVFGQAINFNGSTQYLETPASSFSSAITGLQDWTIRFKIKFNALGYNYYIFGQCNNNVSKSILVELTTANKILIAASGSFILTSAQSITDTNFHEIAIERYNGVMSIYIDGVKDTNTYSGGLSLTNTSDPYQIAGDYGNSQYRLNGVMDEFVIYNTAVYKGQSYTPATSETPYIAPSLNAIVKASESEPLIITAADGYNAKGAVDYTTAITTDSTVTLAPNTTNYIYAEYDKTSCAWSFGATTIAPIYNMIKEIDIIDTNIFDITKMKMFKTSNIIDKSSILDFFSDGSSKVLYRFENNVDDVSGNYNATANSITYGTGRFGKASIFSGSNSYITMPNYTFGYNWTISGWINIPAVNGAVGSLLRTCATGLWGYGLYIVAGYNGSQATVSVEWCNANGLDAGGTIANIPVGTWVHIAVVGANGIMSLYVNGVLQGTATQANTNQSTTPVLGNFTDNNANYGANISIDQLRLFTKSASSAEVGALYLEQLGSAVVVNPRVFLGEVVTDSSKATNTTSYAIKGKYIGQEFTPTASSIKVENHNIGTNHNFINAKCALRWNSAGNGELTQNAVYDISGATQGSLGNATRGAAINIKDNKKLALVTGTYLDGAINTGYSFSSMKATILAERGW